MTKIEKIIFKRFDGDIQLTDTLVEAFEEYAELYATEFRNNLLENGYYDDYGELHVDTTTIKTLPLQPHD